MQRHAFIRLALAGVLLSAACRDAAAPIVVFTTSAPPYQHAEPPFPSFLNLSPSNVSVVVDDTVSVSGLVSRASTYEIDSLSWQVDDTIIASVQVVDKNRILIRPRLAGTLLIDASTAGASPLSARTALTILPRSSQPAPIDAPEFFLTEQQVNGRWDYSPQLALRALGQDSVRLIEVAFEVAGAQAYYRCWTSTSIGQVMRPMFPPVGDGNSLAFSGAGRAPQGAQALARITVLNGDGAATLVVQGEIRSGTIWTSYLEEAPGDWLPCQ